MFSLKTLFRGKQQPASQTRERTGLVVRSFAAAQTDRLLADWRMDFGFTPAEIATQLATLRGRSRQMAKDSPHYKRWLQLVATNVVGEGFALKSMPHDGPPSDRRLDSMAARTIEYHWWRFCTGRDPITGHAWADYTGRKTMPEIDTLDAKCWARDGEYLTQIVRTDRNPYGIAFRRLRPDWLDHTHNVTDTGRGTLIHCGVEMEIGSRRPVAYWFRTVPKNAYSFNARGEALVSIPAAEIIHGYTQEDEDQPRGVPWAHASLRKLKMLDMYDEAELTAARDEACTVTRYTAPLGRENEIADLTDPDDADAAASVRALTAEKQPGQSEVLPMGWDAKVQTPQHPNRELVPFKNGMLRDVASGLGVEYANAFNDWAGVSFSSVRLGTISERDMWITLQRDMIAQSKRRQFNAWLRSFLELSISGGLPLEKFDKFSEHEFRGRRWMWVDPMKDMNAAKMARDHGWKTDSQITEDLGGDYDDNQAEIKRNREARQKHGNPEPMIGNGNVAQPKQEVSDEDEAK